MNKIKNSIKVWDNVWKNSNTKKTDIDNFNIAKNSIHWIRMRKILINQFGSLKGLKSIELGAGSGMNSLLLAKEGVDVTILDYSDNAIKASKLLFKRNNAKATFILQDVFKIDKDLLNRFDISMSFGTAEHFFGNNRFKFIKIHLNVLKKNGITFICVPNKWNILYRFHKYLSQLFGKWNFGEEYPFSQIEFKDYGKKLNQKFRFIGSSLFFDPFLFLKRLKRILRYKEIHIITKKELGTPLDKYFSVFITAITIKKI